MTAAEAFSRFGLVLGIFPPAAFFANILFDTHNIETFVLVLFLLTNAGATVGAYFSGKMIGRMTLHFEKRSWSAMLLVTPLIGILWGIISGAAGGVFLLVFGAFFGAIIGGTVGAIALPIFAVFHRLLKAGDKIEEKEFFPIAFGISLGISAFILSIPN